MHAKPAIAAEVAALSDLSREELVKRWLKIYGALPPKGVRRELMIRAIAWHLQAKRLGGLSAETRRLLRSAISKVAGDILARDKRAAIANGGAVNTADGVESVAGDDPPATVSPTPCERRRLTPSARLMREWGGRTHVVDVIEGGYVFEAKVYPSLTAIADKITGVHWSGPRFFGL